MKMFKGKDQENKNPAETTYALSDTSKKETSTFLMWRWLEFPIQAKGVCTNAKKVNYNRIQNFSYRHERRDISCTELLDISFCMRVCKLQSSSNDNTSLFTVLFHKTVPFYSVLYGSDNTALPITLVSYFMMRNQQIAAFFVCSHFSTSFQDPGVLITTSVCEDSLTLAFL